MVRSLYARLDLFLYCYLVMVFGCVYYLFNFVEGIPFTERAGESQLFRVCWLALYFILLSKIAFRFSSFVHVVRHSVLFSGFLISLAATTASNGIQAEDAVKLAMYLLTILFSLWLALTISVDRLVEVLYRIGAVVLVIHVLLFPLTGSVIDYDPLHRVTVLGTEPYAGVFGHKNIAGSFFAMLALLSLIRLLSKGRRAGWSALLLVLHLLALAAAGAAGAIIALVGSVAITIGIYLTLVSNRQFASLYWLCMAAAILLLLSVRTEEIYELVGRTSGLTGRSFLWSAWPHFFWQKPWLGYGFGGFFSGVFNAPVNELTRMAPWNTVYGSFENSYLDVLLQFGMIGGGIYILIILVACWKALQFSYRSTESLRLAPIGLITLTMLLTANDSSLILHNYITCVLVFWCYFGPEAMIPSAAVSYRPLLVRGV